MSTKTLISVAEFDRLVEPDDLRYELDKGELIEMTRPRVGHNRVVMRLTRVLLQYLQKNPVGELFSSDNLFVLGPATKRAPDLSFMLAGRASTIDPAKDIQGAPDLAIEVLSPSDKAAAMRRKVKQYFAAGASTVLARAMPVRRRPTNQERETLVQFARLEISLDDLCCRLREMLTIDFGSKERS